MNCSRRVRLAPAVLWVFSVAMLHLIHAEGRCAVADDEAPVWECRAASTPPVIDGAVDAVWDSATPLVVTVREAFGGTGPIDVTLRALHTEDAFFVLAEWPDATESAMRDPYIWDEETHAYERPTRPDDQFALEFPISGEFEVSMLSTGPGYIADVWHWKAGRGNPVGWVDDKRHIIAPTPLVGALEYSLGGRGTIYIARVMDEGTSAYDVRATPASFEGEVVDSFTQREPTGSLADVRGRGVHSGTGWTLEMTRALDTGHADDAVIDPAHDMTCAIAVLNDELYWNHSVSGPITLRFVGGDE